MRKIIFSLVVLTIVAAISINTVFANGFGGGNRGGSFGSAGFGPTTINSRVSYDALGDLVYTINGDIKQGLYTNSPISGRTDLSCSIRYDSTNDWYVIQLKIGSTWYTFHNASGGVYYCEADEAPTSIFVELNNLNSKINTLISNFNSKLTGVQNSLDIIVSRIARQQYCGYVNNSSGNAFPTIQINNTVRDQMIAQLNTTYSGSYINYVSVTDGSLYRMRIEYAIAASGGYIKVHTSDPQASNQFYDYYLCDSKNNVYISVGSGSASSFDDTDILNAIDDLNIDITNTISNSASNTQNILQNLIDTNEFIVYATAGRNTNNQVYSTTDAPYSSVYGMVNFLNQYLNGRNVRVFNNDSSTSGISGSQSSYTEYPFMWARIGSPSQDTTIINIGVNENGVITTYTLCNASRYQLRFRTDQDASMRRYDNIITLLTNIDNNVQSIFEYLDNEASLNDDNVQEYLEEFGDDVDTFGMHALSGARLFKSTFHPFYDNYSDDVFRDAYYYIENFWNLLDAGSE